MQLYQTEDDDVADVPSLTELPPSSSSAAVPRQKHGGGLGTPSGAMTVISGFSDENDPIATVLNKHGLGWPGMLTF